VSEAIIAFLKPVVLILVSVAGIILLFKTCETGLQEFKEFFHGLIVAALHELTFSGGRAAKANIILSALIGILFVFICLPDELREFRDLLGGAPHSGTAKYLLFGCLLGFFFLSLCFVFALEMYSKKTRR